MKQRAEMRLLWIRDVKQRWRKMFAGTGKWSELEYVLENYEEDLEHLIELENIKEREEN